MSRWLSHGEIVKKELMHPKDTRRLKCQTSQLCRVEMMHETKEKYIIFGKSI